MSGRQALSILVLAAMVGGPESLSARAADDEAETKVQVRVDNQAGVDQTILKIARARASQVFARSRVRIEWIDGADAARLKLRAPYTILIMAEGPAKLKATAENLAADVMAQGAPVAGRAYIYYDRVVSVLVPPRDIASMLGDVMAHELGHLLLPPGHSSVGIMRPGINMWSRVLETFTKTETAEMHRRLRERAPSASPEQQTAAQERDEQDVTAWADR